MISKIGSATFINPARIIKLSNYLKKNKINNLFFCSSPTFKLGSIAAKLAGVEKIVYRRGSAIPINDKFYNHFLLNNCVTDFIANSKATKREALKYMTDFPQERAQLIYNGVKIDRFKDVQLKTNIHEEFNIPEDKLVLVNVGRLHQQKGQSYLIDAVDKLKENYQDFVVLLVGDGPKEKELKARVKELGVEDYIIFAGFRKDIPSLLTQSDFMVHTALWEGFGFVIAEAMAAGIPVVATDCSNIPELITPGKDGFLAESENYQDIAEQMLKMCNSEIEEMGKAARETAQERFSFARMVEETDNLIVQEGHNERI
jgi:glycosyltransferase involved in cell wall biosynthesis